MALTANSALLIDACLYALLASSGAAQRRTLVVK
jgi:hypothetical protein